MAKKQTRRSISVSKATYSRLRAYCETNGISMSQFVERRVGDFLGRGMPAALSAPSAAPKAAAPAPRVQPTAPARPAPVRVTQPAPRPRRIEPEGPQLKDPDQKLTAEQIFTF